MYRYIPFPASYEGHVRLLAEGSGCLVVPRTHIWVGRYQKPNPSGGGNVCTGRWALVCILIFQSIIIDFAITSDLVICINLPVHNAVFNITRPCRGIQNDNFAVCLL